MSSGGGPPGCKAAWVGRGVRAELGVIANSAEVDDGWAGAVAGGEPTGPGAFVLARVGRAAPCVTCAPCEGVSEGNGVRVTVGPVVDAAVAGACVTDAGWIVTVGVGADVAQADSSSPSPASLIAT